MEDGHTSSLSHLVLYSVRYKAPIHGTSVPKIHMLYYLRGPENTYAVLLTNELLDEQRPLKIQFGNRTSGPLDCEIGTFLTAPPEPLIT